MAGKALQVHLKAVAVGSGAAEVCHTADELLSPPFNELWTEAITSQVL